MCRAIRVRRGWRQADLASRAGVHQSQVSRLERGRIGAMRLDTARRIFVSLGATLDASPRWRGADLDRLLDEAHAALVEEVARHAERTGWIPLAEVTYSEFGERGSIDLLAARADHRAIAVFEMKTDVPKVEEMLRRHDEKARLAPKIAKARLGWWPECVARVLVLPESDRLRRLLDRHHATLRSAYPASGRAIRRWLLRPTGDLAAIWFISGMRTVPATGRARVTSRVRKPAPSTD